jgi:hypothetical protein
MARHGRFSLGVQMIRAHVTVYGAKEKELFGTSVDGVSINSALARVSRAIREARKDKGEEDKFTNWRDIEIFISKSPKYKVTDNVE